MTSSACLRILLVRLSSFGDVVFTLPLAQALKGAWPGTRLAWVVEAPLAPLLEGAAAVDEVMTATTRRWRREPFSAATRAELATLRRRMRAFAPEVAVDAQGLFKSALVTLLAPAGRKVGFGFRSATEGVNALVTDEHVGARDRRHVTDRALALAEHLTGRRGFPRVPDVSHLVARPAPEVDAWLEARRGRPFALLQPFASARQKEWPDALVREAAGLLAARHGLPCAVRWGPGERERAEALVRSAPAVLELAPSADPAASARLASRAALFLGSDTGPTHLAAAAGTPTLALFGPTDPERFAPLGPRTAVVRANGWYTSDRSTEASVPSHLESSLSDEVLSAVAALLS